MNSLILIPSVSKFHFINALFVMGILYSQRIQHIFDRMTQKFPVIIPEKEISTV